MQKMNTDLNNGERIQIRLKDIIIGGEEKVIISGPCAIESYETMFKISKELKSMGIKILRGGAYKPRTSPFDFQGLAEEGLKILKSIGRELDMLVSTEVVDTRDVEKSLDYLDIIQIGSRNMYNYSLLKEVGKTRVPIILKRGMSASINEWILAAEYIMQEGNHKVILCERGIRTFETNTRNTLDLNAVAYLKDKCRLPVIVDPSHGTGLRELVYPMSLASIAAGADGLIIESHICPEESVSDARQTIPMDTLRKIFYELRMKDTKKI